MSNDLTLNNAKLFVKYEIVGCSLTGATRLRFFELGLTVGTVVEVVKMAPLGDPLEIKVRGYLLCIRRKVAEGFAVKEVQNAK
jgi:Fe2+ transport system protein FeoA